MAEFINTYNLTGIVIGFITFLIIGVFHPLVIKGEYYFGTKCWWVFLLMGIAGLSGAVCWHGNTILSVSSGVFGFSAFWGINELFEQKKRVERGWFPKRENKGI
ncbi:MAG: DUF4491 family protein [Dysgonamonadaceae bacterium]|jgi:hypothetical protein|nr:DUF4491 family protein [Dysgonamonadaceae bacterium]